MDSTKCIIYGAYGYTGRLITEKALASGWKPVLGGRNREKLEAVAAQYGLEHRAFGLETPEMAAAGLADMQAVIHCAGPFAHTAEVMAEACLRTGVHYLDITGEIEVFEKLAARDERAKEAGITLLPGGGFDVVPSDCLARRLKEKLPEADTLTLAFWSSGKPSHGTALTILESAWRGPAIRKNGVIHQDARLADKRAIDFGERSETCIRIAWGDVSTAFYSTGIGTISVYTAVPSGVRIFSSMMARLGPLTGSAPVQALLKKLVPEGGPSPEERQRSRSLLWGGVTAPDGRREEARLKTPDGYSLTADTAVLIARRMLEGDAPPGFQTPAKACGADFILEAQDTAWI
jgi:short subunit dehydrogenase-like uncharacterized protein